MKLKLDWQQTRRAVDRFFFAPASPAPLASLRIGIALTLLAQAWFIYPDFFELFGTDGILQEPLARYLSDPYGPRLAWFSQTLESWGLSYREGLVGLGALYLLSLFSLLVGFFSRPAAILTWATHWLLMNTGYCTNYGADTYAHVFLFYLMFFPTGGMWSLDSLMGRRFSPEFARFSLRVAQLHLCISYMISAVDKGVGPQWWDGEVIWRALLLPIYDTGVGSWAWMASVPWLPKILGWGTLVLEGFYPLYMWPKRTRIYGVLAISALHIGIVVFLGLGIFGVIMTVLTVSAFGIESDPQKSPFSAFSTLLRPGALFHRRSDTLTANPA